MKFENYFLRMNYCGSKTLNKHNLLRVLGCTMSNILPYRADYYPILGHLLDEMQVAKAIDETITVDDSQSKIDVGTFTCLFILNLLGDVNVRLFRMHEFFEDKALPLLIPWKPDIELDEINDDRAGRVLDALWKADPQKVLSAVVNEAIRIHNLDTNEIHCDTTSKSFQGAYDHQDAEGMVPLITYGYNKDHRPDLKQLVFGVGTTADGIPIMGEVNDGNESDMTLNGRWVKKLRSILGKDLDEFLLYVADSALVTTDNLPSMDDYHIDFISRFPGRFSLEEELKRQALTANEWDSIGKLSDEKKAASYEAWDTTGEVEGRTYRFIVVRSDQKDKRKLKSLDKRVKRESTAIEKKLKELRKRPFACKKDAEIEAEKFLKKHKVKYHQFDWLIEEKEETVKRKKRGRPKKGEKPKYQTNYYLRGKLKRDENTYARERELCALFVLITSLMDIVKYPAKMILEKYKGQGNVERIFKFIKNPAWIGAFCLKKPERLAALGYVLLMAAMVYTLWERRVRKALAKDDETPIEGLDRKKTKKPTSYALQTVMSSILVLAQRVRDKWIITLPRELKPNQKRVIELSGFDESIYHWAGETIEKINRNYQGGCGM